MTRERAAKPAVRRSTVFEPWAPPVDATAFDVASLKAVASGTGTEQQQKNAMRFIVKALCETDEMTFNPTDPDGRISAFAEGKRRVGLMIRSYLAADVSRFKDPDSPPSEMR